MKISLHKLTFPPPRPHMHTHMRTHILHLYLLGAESPPEAPKEHPPPLSPKKNSQRPGLKASPQITKHGCPHGVSLSIAVSITSWPHHDVTNLYLQLPKKTLTYSTPSSQLLPVSVCSDPMPFNITLHSTLQYSDTPSLPHH